MSRLLSSQGLAGLKTEVTHCDVSAALPRSSTRLERGMDRKAKCTDNSGVSLVLALEI